MVPVARVWLLVGLNVSMTVFVLLIGLGGDHGFSVKGLLQAWVSTLIYVREKVFTPFFTTKSRGSGLGLATAKRLIEAQNGQISIACPPAGGTTVTVSLPTAGVAT